jgi:hypothetical protein
MVFSIGHAVDDSLATVFEVKASVRILATQECAPHTSGDEVVVRRVFQLDLAVSGLRHDTSLVRSLHGQ